MGGSSSTSKNSLVELENLNDSIYIFHNPVHHKKETKALFIFFHDILWPGNEKTYVQTWMSSGSPSVCWPKAWLSARYPKAQILSTCYNASLWKQKSTGHIDIELIVESLWQDILSVCERNCPIFLIGHGLGGIVIKAIIRAMQFRQDALNNCRTICNDLKNNSEIHRLDCFLKNVKGVFYYATPFLGLRLVNSINFPSKSPLLDPLEMLSTYTCRLNEFFRYWRSYRNCKATAVFALLPTNVSFWYGDRCTVVVEEGSARYDVDNFYPATKCDHFRVCKPQTDKDSSFQILIEFFDSGMQAITDGPHAHIENTEPRRAWIEYVENILSELHNLGGDGLQLNRLHLEQLQEFEDVWSKLINGLKEAGFEKTSNDGHAEQWELQPRHKYYGWEPGHIYYD